MERKTSFERVTRGVTALFVLLPMFWLLPGSWGLAGPSQAVAQQYFGRNKVQFDDFDFEILPTEHFDIHYYPEEREAVRDAARMGERWYERFARAFQHEFEAKKPIIFYADHPDFQQTNTLSGFIGEGTGGVTESLKNRVIMPLAGSYWDTDHVLGHEIVHAFQYNIAQSRRGGAGMRGLSALPLWLVEGMAEYLSVGRDDPLTAMWIRDAIISDDLPTIEQMTKESRYFPYRFGQAIWAYIGGTYGDDAVIQIFRMSLGIGFEGAIRETLGISSEELSEDWREQVALEYTPLIEERTKPGDDGRLILAPSTGSGTTNIAPSISPDGRYLAYLSEKDLFSVDLFLAETATGRIVRKLSSANSDPHVDALRYVDSSGTWSPDSRLFAFVVTAAGKNELVIVRSSDGGVETRYAFDEIGAITNPAWSPDGRSIAFSGSVGGITDLFAYRIDEDRLVRLTNDKFADLHPSWSPDGRRIVFSSDRGPETNFDRLTYSSFQLVELEVATGEISHIPVFGNVKHINPVYAPDGRSIYFISDQDGFSDIYSVATDNGEVRRVTNLTTGVSGHTYLAPAMSLSSTGQLAYTVFNELEFHVYTKPATGSEAIVQVVEDRPKDQPGRKLVPSFPDRFSRIATYLADAETGLPPAAQYDEAPEEYRSGMTLDYVGQPTLGIGTDNFGNYVGGGASAYFSDMLGNRVLGVAAQAQGSFKDIGAQAFYSNLSSRWNWGVGGGHVPSLFPFWSYGQDNQGFYTAIQKYRIFVTSATAQASYPFSSSQRLELSAGPVRYGYDIEVDKYYQDIVGRVYHFDREQLDAPDPLTMVRASAAFVGDNSFHGFVSPIRGGRYRFQVEQSAGSVDFTTIIGDWRRYWAPHRDLTVAFRAFHYGRYGLTTQEQAQDGFGLLRPLFLGYETLIRGYAYESFDASECTNAGCFTFNRLWGQQIGVGSLEFRIPLVGVEQYGIINFPFVPVELVLFADGGAAWNSGSCAGQDPLTGRVVPCDGLSLEWTRDGTARVPVFSTGVSARMNILGFLLLESYYAYPWQRPGKGWHWGFQLAPGW